jgi:hypothetical protein
MNFRVGDKVKVVQSGHTYTTYKSMAKYMHLSNWDKHGIPNMNHDFAILAIEDRDAPDEYKLTDSYSKRTVIAGILDLQTGKTYMVGVEGLKLIIIDLLTIEDFEL